ncbi:hypothetical protein ACEZDB_31800 [Streptacidiphilus sp. N1-3]|uniref:Uncharacterized protein n=1 Tax=Streptacidiphilus alkalitolerans TaxID=3342712 RepID=A0ABV6XAG2_9ACTN
MVDAIPTDGGFPVDSQEGPDQALDRLAVALAAGSPRSFPWWESARALSVSHMQDRRAATPVRARWAECALRAVDGKESLGGQSPLRAVAERLRVHAYLLDLLGADLGNPEGQLHAVLLAARALIGDAPELHRKSAAELSRMRLDEVVRLRDIKNALPAIVQICATLPADSELRAWADSWQSVATALP